MCSIGHQVRQQYLENIGAIREQRIGKLKENAKEFTEVMCKGFIMEFVVPEYMPYKEVVSSTVMLAVVAVFLKKAIFRGGVALKVL